MFKERVYKSPALACFWKHPLRKWTFCRQVSYEWFKRKGDIRRCDDDVGVYDICIITTMGGTRARSEIFLGFINRRSIPFVTSATINHDLRSKVKSFPRLSGSLLMLVHKLSLATDKSKKCKFRHSPFSKKCKSNNWPCISGYICPGTQSFDLPTPNFAGSSNLSSVPGSGPGTES